MASSAGTRIAADKPELASKSILGPGAARLAKGPDLSQLKPPIKTSVSGTRQVIHAMETATGEVKNLLLDEINLMYECKTCQSVFRSLANLISHKRVFCKSRYNEVLHLYQDKEGSQAANLQTVIIEAEPVECALEGGGVTDLTDYSPSVELLKTSGILEDIQGRGAERGPPVNRLLPHYRPGLKNVVAKLKARLDGTEARFYENVERNFEAPKPNTVVHLEPMLKTENALMQTWRYREESETVGEQYMGWQEAEEDKGRLMLGPKGEVMTRNEIVKLVTGPDDRTYSVRVPRNEWETSGEEEKEMQVKYPCMKCKKKFSKVSSVFNHMVKEHDKTMKEAKQLKQTIRDGAVSIDKVDNVQKKPGSGDFRYPVKPCEIKLKNYTLNLRNPTNLCEQLQTSQNTGCPIINSCLSGENEVKKKICDGESKVEKKVTDINNEIVQDAINGDIEDGDILEGEGLESGVTTTQQVEVKVPAEVERVIMEHVNRRRVQCKLCNKRFNKSLHVRNHVAWEHLRLARWKCTVCCHTSWTKEQCEKHVETEHKVTEVGVSVKEQPLETYFSRFTEQTSIEKEVPDEITDEVLEDYDEALEETKSTKSTDTEVQDGENSICVEKITLNGSDEDSKDTIEDTDKHPKENNIHDIEDDDSDGEISFKDTSSPLTSGSPSLHRAPSPPASNKRRRSPSRSPSPVRSGDTSPTSTTSLLSKVMMSLPMLGWTCPVKEQPSSAPTLSKVARFKVPDSSTEDIRDTPRVEGSRTKGRPPKRARSKSRDSDSVLSSMSSAVSDCSSNSSRAGSLEPRTNLVTKES